MCCSLNKVLTRPTKNVTTGQRKNVIVKGLNALKYICPVVDFCFSELFSESMQFIYKTLVYCVIPSNTKTNSIVTVPIFNVI